MRFPVQITFHGMDRSDSLDAKIRERLDKVEHLCPRITGCRVVVEAPHKIHLSIRLPRTLLSVSKGEQKNGQHLDLPLVVRQAFDAVERALREFNTQN